MRMDCTSCEGTRAPLSTLIAVPIWYKSIDVRQLSQYEYAAVTFQGLYLGILQDPHSYEPLVVVVWLRNQTVTVPDANQVYWLHESSKVA
jgi:hypothetical protein